MKNSNMVKKCFFVGVAIILIGFCIYCFVVINNRRQEDILKEEIVSLTNMDLLSDDYNLKIKTKGDYAYIEKAVKIYYKTLSDSVKVIHSYLSDEALIGILSADNLEKDGPKFQNSRMVISDTRKKSGDALNTIISLCDEEGIKKLIDEDKIGDYYYELYLGIMYTDNDLKMLMDTKSKMSEISEKLNTFLDKVEVMINMLEDNKDRWFIEDGQLYFETNSLVNKYNNLYNDLKQYSELNFSEYKDDDVIKQQTSV